MKEVLLKLVQRVADLERRVAGMIRVGDLASVDPATGEATMNLGPGHEGPPSPYAQHGGPVKLHMPPGVGQQVMAFCPDGDPRSAIIFPMSFGGGNASPGSTGDANVLTFGGVTMSLWGDAVVIAIGGATITVNGQGITVSGGDVVADGKSLKTHTHTDTAGTGAGTTSPPN